ncbi:MAG TPA: prepilin-type N-terminal cleavage/methylation domain-containing protein [Polyangiales bacterium]
MKTRAPRRSPRRAGFTLLEVMIAGAVFTIGIVGVTYMQSASVRSNQDAYESMVATHFAKQWLERIKRDALSWTAPGTPSPASMGFTTRTTPPSATYFMPDAPLADSGLWPLDITESTGINYHGFEVGQMDPVFGRVDQGQIYYCAFGRFFSSSFNQDGLLSSMTVRVTVWWNRKGSLETTSYAEIDSARRNGCDRAALGVDVFSDTPPLPSRLRRVRLATAIRFTPP